MKIYYFPILIALTFFFHSNGYPQDSAIQSTILEAHKNRINSIAFSPDNKTLASGSWDKTVRLWDVQNQSLKTTLNKHTDYVYCVVFSPDGKTLASGSEDYSIRLWDVKTGTLAKTLWRHIGGVYCLAYSPDGKILASAGEDRTIQLCDANSGNHKANLEGHKDFVYTLVFSPHGRTLLSGGGLLRLGYRPTATTDVHTHTGNVGDIIIWNLLANKRLSTISGHNLDIYALTISPNGNMIVAGGGLRFTGRFADIGEGGRQTGGDISIWNARTKEFKFPLKGHLNDVYSIVFSPDGSLIASGSVDETIRLWDAETGILKATLTGHKGAITSLAFSNDGKTLASASIDSTIRLWSLPANLDVTTTSPVKKPTNKN